MTERNEIPGTDAAIEALLREAPPRPAPSTEDMADVREAVRDEWAAVTGRRRTRRRLISFAAAATVILAVATTVNVLRVPSALPVPVATIDKTSGSIYLLGEQSELRETQDLAELTTGQVLVTGPDSGAGIAWNNGGSLRIDEDTRVEFVSPDEIMLRSGRVYFDSQPTSLQAGITQSSIASFAIRTDQGVVRHVGTQYMTGISGGALTVSVREGRIEVDGTYHTGSAKAGERLTLAGSNRPSITNISSHGDEWRWVESMAPAIGINDPTIDQFVNWVAREAGFEVHFTSDAVKQFAEDKTMYIPDPQMIPREALRILMPTTDLVAIVNNGKIIISER